MSAVMFAHLEDRHDAGMIELGRRLRLGAEATDLGRAGELPGEDHLQRDRAVEADLPGPVHDAHPAAGDLRLALIVAEIANRGPGRGALRRGGIPRIERERFDDRHGDATGPVHAGPDGAGRSWAVAA